MTIDEALSKVVSNKDKFRNLVIACDIEREHAKNNGKLFGFVFQSRLLDFLTSIGIRSETIPERKGQKNNRENRDDSDILLERRVKIEN